MIAAFIVAVVLVSFFVITNGTSEKSETPSEQAQNANVEEDIVVVKIRNKNRPRYSITTS